MLPSVIQTCVTNRSHWSKLQKHIDVSYGCGCDGFQTGSAQSELESYFNVPRSFLNLEVALCVIV